MRAHSAWGGRTISNVWKKQIALNTVNNGLHQYGLTHVQKEQSKLRFQHDAYDDLGRRIQRALSDARRPMPSPDDVGRLRWVTRVAPAHTLVVKP